ARERTAGLERRAGWATRFGLPLELVSAEEAPRRFPLMTQEGVLGAAFLPADGYLEPGGLALALAEGARRGGARICEGVRVTGLNLAHGRIRGVATDHGAIETEVVVNAGGIYAPEIGAMAGVSVPIIPMAHQYLVTRIADPIPEDLPTMRDPDLLVYFRRDAGGMGAAMAEWIIDGEPSLDLWKMDLRRFGAQYRSQAYTLARTVEVYSTYYDIHYPNEEREAGRPLRLSPTYSRLRELGACFGE